MRSVEARRRAGADRSARRIRRPAGRARAAVLFGLALLTVPRDVRPAGDVPPAYQNEIEASFVYTVAKFVDWPSAAFGEPGSPLVFVVLGSDPVESSLEKMVEGKSVGGHPVTVVRARREDDLVPCHVLFVGRSEAERVDEVIERLKGESVLTVGDFDRFAQRGGVLRFHLDENMVTFEVNVDAAERAHLQISSKILKLGRVVRDRKHAGARP